MTVQSLITKLEAERQRIDEALKILRPYSNTSMQIQQTWTKRQAVNMPKRRPAKKKHWTQTAAGKARMSVIQKKAWEKRR